MAEVLEGLRAGVVSARGGVGGVMCWAARLARTRISLPSLCMRGPILLIKNSCCSPITLPGRQILRQDAIKVSHAICLLKNNMHLACICVHTPAGLKLRQGSSGPDVCDGLFRGQIVVLHHVAADEHARPP